MGLFAIYGGVILLVFGLVALFTWLNNEEEVDKEKEKKKDDIFINASVGAIITFVVLFCFSIILLPSIILSNIGTVNRLESFYDANARVYIEATNILRNGVPQAQQPSTLFETPNFKQIEYYQRVVVEMRDEVVSYNKNLKTHLYWQNNWYFGSFIKDVRGELAYITID